MLGPADGIDREAVDSSNIESIGYSPDRRVLAVEFKSGAIFHYFNVDDEFAVEFYAAESKGKFFAQRIKGKLTGDKMTGPCSSCHEPGVAGTTCACGGTFYKEEKRYERSEE